MSKMLEEILYARRLKKVPEENSDSLDAQKGKERIPIRKMKELAEETNALFNHPNVIIAEATEGMNGVGYSIGPVILKGDANLLAKKAATEEQMKRYLGSNFDKNKYINISDYREKMNYYYYIEKNSLDEVNPREIIKNRDGTIKVKNKEGRVITLSEEKNYEETLYHQKIYDSKGNFTGIKSHINSSLNRKFKSRDGYELILSKDMKSVIKDEYNRGTFNWDSDNNFEHYSSDVQFYTKYGSGINDRTTEKERKKTGQFIDGYWLIIKTEGNNLKKYVEKNKITVITPKVLENYKSKVMSKMLNEKDFIRR